jgi:hypothetical protein
MDISVSHSQVSPYVTGLNFYLVSGYRILNWKLLKDPKPYRSKPEEFVGKSHFFSEHDMMKDLDILSGVLVSLAHKRLKSFFFSLTSKCLTMLCYSQMFVETTSLDVGF